MSIVLPFNFQPASVDVKVNTSNEAIAAGKYALITYFANGQANGDDFFINDESAAPTITATVGQPFVAQFWVPTGTNLRVAGNGRYTVQLFNELT